MNLIKKRPVQKLNCPYRQLKFRKDRYQNDKQVLKISDYLNWRSSILELMGESNIWRITNCNEIHTVQLVVRTKGLSMIYLWEGLRMPSSVKNIASES
ncbi:hypothetical protein DERP_009653 [Dermatophagoides pteronyssinus]|uniref:Uncharacterized protein n=1 Tax=Dermatophagoides pteronyssinus TaxID=6956 RepID=A0ABQ8JAY7_DERPT|nr:hypothetical protein DERP_009653 [Dermatophagoides pteronyssinus]